MNPRARRRTRSPIEQILREFRRAERFVIASHVRGDGDSVGSEVALVAVLRAMGKKARVIKSDTVPPRYAFLARGWVRQRFRSAGPIAADCVVVLDSPALARVGSPVEAALPDKSRARWISIDHHLGHAGFAHVNWVDTQASCVGEMLYRLIRRGPGRGAALPLPPLARDGIYVAIMTDTGQFGFSNTSSESLRIAAELIDAGADPARLAAQIYQSKTATELALERRALASLKISGKPHAGRVAWVSVLREDFRAAGGGPEHLREAVEIPRQMAGVEVAVLFYEPPGSRVTKVSLRSQGSFSVRAVAAKFGGGGHRRAAGCELAKPLAAARKLVIAEILRRLAARRN